MSEDFGSLSLHAMAGEAAVSDSVPMRSRIDTYYMNLLLGTINAKVEGVGSIIRST